MRHNGNGRLWAGLAAGLAGGLAASWVMHEYQNLWSKFASQGEGAARRNNASDSPTVKTAVAVSQKVLGRDLHAREKKAAGPAVHYLFGAAVGGAYGLAAELAPKASAVAGLPFGAAVWLGADEIALPLLGLTPPAKKSSLSAHAYALTSHLVYGAVADGVRRAMRKIWR